MNKEKSPGFLGHAATYAAANVARRFVGFAMLPIYTRFLTPADYGVIGLLMFALAVFEPIFGARLGYALVKYYAEESSERAKREVIWGALVVTGSVSAVGTLLLILLRGIGSEMLFGDQKYALALGIFAVNLLSRPLEENGMLVLQMNKRSRAFLQISMTKLMFQVVLNVLLVVVYRMGVVGVVLSGAISSSALALGITYYLFRTEPPVLNWSVSKKMIEYCLPLWFAGLAGLYIAAAGGVYLRVFGNLSEVGRLELALRFSSVVGLLIWAPFSQHWSPMSYQYFKDGSGKVKFQAAFIGIAILMISGGLGISIFAGSVIQVMATKPFYAAAELVPILVLGVVLNYLRSFFDFSFLVTDNTKISGMCQYATVAIITVAYLTLVPRYHAIGVVLAQFVALSASFLYTWILSRRYFDPEFDIGTVMVLLLTGIICFLCAGRFAMHRDFVVSFIGRAIIWAVGTILIFYIGVRKIKRIEAAFLDKLPWPLNKFGGVDFVREL